MTSYVVFTNTNVTTAAPAYALVSSDTLLIAQNATLVYTGTGNSAVTGAGSSDILIGGALVAAGTNSSALRLTGDSTHYVTLQESGSIYAYLTGIVATDTKLVLTNNGEIAGSTALRLTGTTTSVIFNNGLISAAVSMSETSKHNFVNTGTITAQVSSTTTGTVTFTNSGVMTVDGSASGLDTAAYNSLAGTGVDIFTNSGFITGGVYTGGGNDFYDGRDGRVTGVVSGGLGDDRLVGGMFGDILWGDDTPAASSNIVSGGADYLAGGYGDDVLYGGFGADQLYGNQDNDVLYGNQDNDWLHGGQGDDLVYGGQGNDTLNGGKGDDVLFGNLGDDRFEFTGRGFGHDRIADFRASGANDIIFFTTDIFSDFTAVQAGATAVSNGALLTVAGGDTLLLVGIAPGALTSAMFAFG